MGRKRNIAALLAALLILTQGVPVLAAGETAPPEPGPAAEERLQTGSGDYQGPEGDLTGPALPRSGPDQPPEHEGPWISVELITEDVEEESKWEGLYVVLHDAPENLSLIFIDYAYNGLEYYYGEGSIYGEENIWLREDGTVWLYCYEMDEMPLSAFLSGTAMNSLYFQLGYTLQDDPWDAEIVYLEPARISHGGEFEPPDTPPDFAAEIKQIKNGYSIFGHFQDFAPNVADVRCAYSWDGIDYESDTGYWNMQGWGSPEEGAQAFLEYQEIVQRNEEPLDTFLNGGADSFYLRLEITTEEGWVYHSKPVFISRAEREPLPEHLTPRVALGFDLALMESELPEDFNEDEDDFLESLLEYTHGQYRLTVGEDATPEEIAALLPDEVPIQVRLWNKDTRERYAYGNMLCPVTWKEIPQLDLTAGETFVLDDMAQPLVVPAGTEVWTKVGSYLLNEDLTFQSRYDSDEIRLVLQPVAAEDPAQVVLRGYRLDLVDEEDDWNWPVDPEDPLDLAFWNKPSGATAIHAYARVGEERIELGDLLQRRAVDHNQSSALYGFVPVLQCGEYPYSAYLDGALEEFFIGVEIEGGVFDGQQLEQCWPGEYTLPDEIPDPMDDNSGGENNAGMGFEDIEEGGSDGQREWLPPEDQQAPEGMPPPIVIPPEGGEVTPPEDGGDVPPEPVPPDEEPPETGPSEPTPTPTPEKEPPTKGERPRFKPIPPFIYQKLLEKASSAESGTPAPTPVPVQPTAEEGTAELIQPAPPSGTGAASTPAPSAGHEAFAPAEETPAPSVREPGPSAAPGSAAAPEPSTGQRESLPQEPGGASGPEAGEEPAPQPEERPGPEAFAGPPAGVIAGVAAVAVVGGGAALASAGVASAGSGGTGLLAKLGKAILKLFKK